MPGISLTRVNSTHSNLTVDLKYITGSQKITLGYGGNTNIFEVDGILSRSCDKNTSEDLTSQLEALKISPAPQIWTVGWDTIVVVLPADTLKPLESAKVRTIFSPETTAYISGSKPGRRTSTHMLQLVVWINKSPKSGISSTSR